jgi:hypothetical protein
MSDQPSIIEGTSCGVKTMADNTLRVSFDIEPRFAQLAFAMFGTRGTPVAIARLTPEVAQQQARKEAAEPVKGGVLAKLAGMWCADEQFCDWLYNDYRGPPFKTADDAATVIRTICGVGSRAELDHNPQAEEIFHREFRLPYNAWLQGRGGNKA